MMMIVMPLQGYRLRRFVRRDSSANLHGGGPVGERDADDPGAAVRRRAGRLCVCYRASTSSLDGTGRGGRRTYDPDLDSQAAVVAVRHVELALDARQRQLGRVPGFRRVCAHTGGGQAGAGPGSVAPDRHQRPVQVGDREEVVAQRERHQRLRAGKAAGRQDRVPLGLQRLGGTHRAR